MNVIVVPYGFAWKSFEVGEVVVTLVLFVVLVNGCMSDAVGDKPSIVD